MPLRRERVLANAKGCWPSRLPFRRAPEGIAYSLQKRTTMASNNEVHSPISYSLAYQFFIGKVNLLLAVGTVANPRERKGKAFATQYRDHLAFNQLQPQSSPKSFSIPSHGGDLPSTMRLCG